jgi:hypothetical protein
MISRLILLIFLPLLAACVATGSTPRKPVSGFDPNQIAKSDVDRVAEAHQREVFASLKLLAEKLYRRNPREWRKGGQPSLEAAVARIFEANHGWVFSELENKRGTDAIHLAFREDYAGDRVLAFVAGLGGMVMTAFNDKSELFLLDDLDPQALFNAARNVEIAVWKLSNATAPAGELVLLSNEGAGPVKNLSFEREFGKIIGSLDLLSKIIADKTNRIVAKVFQNVATAIFLPVKF